MLRFCLPCHSCRRAVRPVVFGVFCAALSASFAGAQTQDMSVEEAAASFSPYALFQYSTLTGSGNSVTAIWVPVVNSAGKTTYQNISLQFTVDSSGNLALAPGYPKVVPAPPPNVTSFRAGKYVGPSTLFNGAGIINMSGPGVTSGGATEWSVATGSGAYLYTYPQSATFYVGIIANSPLAARLSKAGITSTAWSYGVGGNCSCTIGNGAWYGNSLLGFSQTSNTLTIVSFTDSSGTDHNLPVDQITFTLSQ